MWSEALYGFLASLQNSYAGVSFASSECDLIWWHSFADIISSMGPHWSGGDTSPVRTGILIKWWNPDTDARTGRTPSDRTQGRRGASTSHGRPTITSKREARRRRGTGSPSQPRPHLAPRRPASRSVGQDTSATEATGFRSLVTEPLTNECSYKHWVYASWMLFSNLKTKNGIKGWRKICRPHLQSGTLRKEV